MSGLNSIFIKKTAKAASVSVQETPSIQKKIDSNYYGKIKKISLNNDISYLNRGSVFFLRDKPNDENCTYYHPYIVIQSSYLDKIGKITVFGITSSPVSINMVPIVMKNSIGYIDPHQPYVYKIDEFFEKGTRFIGSIANPQVLELACNLYGLHIGMNLLKSEDEIISDYNKYVYEFKERTKNLKPYKHKFSDAGVERETRELKICFESESESIEPDVEFGINTEESKDILTKDDEQKSDEVYDNDGDISTLPSLIVDTTSTMILSAISEIKNKPECEKLLPRKIENMSDNDKIIFLAIIHICGKPFTASFYKCDRHTINNKIRKIKERYNIIYK